VTRPAATVRGPGPGGWRESIPELIIAGVVIGTSCLAVYGFAGLAAAVIAASLWAIGLLIAADPQRARQLLLRGEQDQDDLWRWLDPARPPETDRRKPGIPPRTLDTIIDLLERL
jgi:hypothetical protein